MSPPKTPKSAYELTTPDRLPAALKDLYRDFATPKLVGRWIGNTMYLIGRLVNKNARLARIYNLGGIYLYSTIVQPPALQG